MVDDNGNSKCCAFVKYVNKESALLAIRALVLYFLKKLIFLQNAQAYMLESNKPLEVRFAEKKNKPI